jgi:HD superfamily phosphohydrolase
MEKIVVCKLVRLAKNGDSFDQKLVAQELRTNAKVDDEYMKRFNENWKTSGQMYIMDEAKTKERDELSVKQEVKKEEVKSLREQLKEEAKELGLTYPKNISNEKLAELIGDKQ